MNHFGDRLAEAVGAKRSVAVVGIDPVLEKMPPALQAQAAAKPGGIPEVLTIFGCSIIGVVADLVPAVKPNIAFYEAHGLQGLAAYNAICAFARSRGLLVLGDIKRGDIGSTAAAYAKAHLEPDPSGPSDPTDSQPGTFRLGPHDAVTLNPYLGSDGIRPFLDQARQNGQGLFCLVKTSNPSGAELQDLALADGGTLAEAAARLVDQWGKETIGKSGLSSVGAVVGATHPEQLGRLRALMPNAPLLVPGYGAQGGTAADVVAAFREDGTGALVNASRSILYAWQAEESPEDWIAAARRATMRMNEDLNQALQAAGKHRILHGQ